MQLSEALRASKIRTALGYIDVGARIGNKIASESITLPAARATDTTVMFTFPAVDASGNIRIDPYDQRAWSDILPEHKEFLFALRWEPQDPKDPLTQLAETLTDWREVD